MTPEEIAFMTRFKTGEMAVDAGTTLLMEGANSPQLFTVLSGLGLRYKTQQDGRRQVLNFVFPGDLLGMQAAVMGEMGHSVEASTDMTLCVFRRADVWTLFKTMPERAFDITWLVAAEESFLGDALTTVGQRPALQRVSWALVRVFRRAQAVGMIRGAAIPMPFRQQDLADALGLSLVHTNKTLARLRESQLAHWSDRRLHIPYLSALARVAEVDLDAPLIRPLI
jgi:CRP-like cAMP-binding protein